MLNHPWHKTYTYSTQTVRSTHTVHTVHRQYEVHTQYTESLPLFSQSPSFRHPSYIYLSLSLTLSLSRALSLSLSFSLCTSLSLSLLSLLSSFSPSYNSRPCTHSASYVRYINRFIIRNEEYSLCLVRHAPHDNREGLGDVVAPAVVTEGDGEECEEPQHAL